jgi:hypothetical protein
MPEFTGVVSTYHLDSSQAMYKYESQYPLVGSADRDSRTIFVAIACYKDEELFHTVLSAVKNAKNSERLHFGISLVCEKEDEERYLGGLRDIPNVNILVQDHVLENVGLGKQRDEANSFYNDEHYYFQIDSHMRFDLYWDDLLIHHFEGLKALGEEKPVVTGYPRGYASDKIPTAAGYFPYFNPMTHETYFRQIRGHNNVPCLRIGRQPVLFFRNTGFLRHGDRAMGRFETIALAPAVSPAQMFAEGQFLKDVPADRSVRFLEEEQYYSILGFMKGYNFYVPRVTGVMHYYTEDDNGTIICDRTGPHDVWPEVFSQQAYFDGMLEGKEVLLALADLKDTERSFEEYEKFIGVSYATREMFTPVDKIIPNDIVNYINFLTELYRFSTTDYISWFREPTYEWRKDLDRNTEDSK